MIRVWCLLGSCALVLAISACGYEVASATVSLEGQRIGFQMLAPCHVPTEIAVRETERVVRISVDFDVDDGPTLECARALVAELESSLGDRDVFIEGSKADVRSSHPSLVEFPYDRDRVTAEEFRVALEAVGRCYEQADPTVTAVVVPDLNWDWYEVTSTDPEFSFGGEIMEACEAEHLDPLR